MVQQRPLPVFTDVANHWASGSIQRLVEQGILNGYADGTYKPNSTVSRAEFTAIIYRFLGFDETPNNVSSFKDIEANAWYALYVNKLQQAGIISGFSDGIFRPDQMISREEAMVILYRVLKDDLVQSDKVDLGFIDKDYISSWAIEAIQALTSTGVISGYPDGTIKPKANIAKGETAAIIAKLIKLNSYLKGISVR